MSQNIWYFIKSMLDTMPNPACYKDKNGVYLGVNSIFATQIAGLPEEEILGYTLPEVARKIVESSPGRSIVNGRSLLRYAEEWDRDNINLLKHSGTITKEYEGICADGIQRTFLVKKSTLCNENGEILGLFIVLQDITKLKMSERFLKENLRSQDDLNERLRRNEERYRIIAEQTGQLVYDYDLKADRGSWAGSIEKITGYSSQELEGLSSETWIERIHPEDRERVIRKLSKLRKEGGNYREEFRLRKKDGTFLQVENSGVYLTDESDQPYRALGVMKDIAEQKATQMQLERSEERYRITAEQTGQLIYDFDLEANQISWSGAIKEITGYTAEELKSLHGDAWLKSIHPEDLKRAIENVDTLLKRGGKLNQEFRFRKKDGNYIYLDEHGVCLLDESGKPSRILGVMTDITEKRSAQQKIQQSEKRYRSFIENFKGIAFQADENFIPQFLHGAVEEVTGYSEEEFMSSELHWIDIIDPECLPAICEKKRKLRELPDSCILEVEYRITSRTGETKWVHETCQKISGKDGNHIYQCMIYDITERKEAEKYLANLEAARKKEIHHRIKNNLQVISSLLDLQAEKFNNKKCISDSEVLEAFRESQDRVMSIALIHEELHEGEADNELNFSLYLQRLVQNLFQTYRLGDIDVSLDLELEENIFFDMDTAVPLGMIVNELVSNSFKYAFPGRDKGAIRIKLFKERKAGNGLKDKEEWYTERSTGYTLIVSDNGTGIPEEIDFENSQTLGLQLVDILVNQLDGEIELRREQGSEFAIWFNDTKK